MPFYEQHETSRKDERWRNKSINYEMTQHKNTFSLIVSEIVSLA
jgi:hypothetical protein